MKLADQCLLVSITDTHVDASGIAREHDLSEVLVLRTLDHPHRAGAVLDDSVAILVGPRAAELVGVLGDGKRRELDLRGFFDCSKSHGANVVAVTVDFVPTDDAGEDQEAEFDAWYTYEHMGDVSRAEGIHRAFRGKAMDERARRYWCLYETDDPSVFMDSRAGKAPWGGLWSANIDQSTFRRSYFTIESRWAKEDRA